MYEAFSTTAFYIRKCTYCLSNPMTHFWHRNQLFVQITASGTAFLFNVFCLLPLPLLLILDYYACWQKCLQAFWGPWRRVSVFFLPLYLCGRIYASSFSNSKLNAIFLLITLAHLIDVACSVPREEIDLNWLSKKQKNQMTWGQVGTSAASGILW